MIRHMKFIVGDVRAVFAKGNFCENIYLWFRGYRRHETMVGMVMAKWWNRPSSLGPMPIPQPFGNSE